ncbi:MAG: alpha/beta hydrolase [Acidobacteriota bacterium]|nr:alpha/beta hydrolase [Acidobacteriota bacterium]
MTRVLIILALLATVVLIAAIALVWSAQRNVLFPRPLSPAFDTSTGIPGVHKLRLGNEETTEAWLLTPPSSPQRSPAIIFAHGNGELIDHWVAEFDVVRNWGVAVLLVEYPGYGRSKGSPSQSSITAAFVEAYDYLAALPEVDADAIIGYGRSLGGGAICQLAARRELTTLILESSFSSVASVAGGMGVPRWLVRDPFDNRAVLEGYSRPVLLLHGQRDQVIPFHHSEALREAAAHSELLPMDCGHNDCPRPWQQLHEFLSRSGVLEPKTDHD